MKRLICIILFCSLAFALAVPAFADEVPFIDLNQDGVNDYSSENGTLNYYYLQQIQDLHTTDTELRNDVDTLRSDLDDLKSSGASDSSVSSDSSTSSDPVESNPLDTSDMVLQSVDVYSVNPVTPQNTSGLKAVILGLIGNYDTVVTDYTYTNNNGYVSHTIEVQPDYVFLCSFAMLFLIIYCLFRLGGALIGIR